MILDKLYLSIAAREHMMARAGARLADEAGNREPPTIGDLTPTRVCPRPAPDARKFTMAGAMGLAQ